MILERKYSYLYNTFSPEIAKNKVMHEEIAYNSRIREEYELSFNNGSSAKTSPCPWANFASKEEWERNRVWYLGNLRNYVVYDQRSKDIFMEEVKRFELDRK